jgi:hypothetical protein
MVEVRKTIQGTMDYGELAQRIWNTASALTSHEDRKLRDYLQWFEGNLDMLINLEGSREAIHRFLDDQLSLLRMAVSDNDTWTSIQWKEALTYIGTTTSSAIDDNKK